MRTNRRHFLNAAALGAGGLIAFEKIAEAAAYQHDHGNPGDGGFGRRVDRLPQGPAVAYHRRASRPCRTSGTRSMAITQR